MRTALLPTLALLAGCAEQPRGAMCASVPQAWRVPETGMVETDGPHSSIWLSKRDIVWNGAVTTPAQLHGYLAASAKIVPPSRVTLGIADDADCEMVREVIADMKRAPICGDLKLCGTRARWPQPPPPDENAQEGR